MAKLPPHYLFNDDNSESDFMYLDDAERLKMEYEYLRTYSGDVFVTVTLSLDNWELASESEHISKEESSKESITDVVNRLVPLVLNLDTVREAIANWEESVRRYNGSWKHCMTWKKSWGTANEQAA